MAVHGSVAVAIAGLVTMASTAGWPEEYPSKPLRFLSGPVAGGGDRVARLLSPALAEALGQPIVMDNRPIVLSREVLAKAPPDGYTLLVGGSAYAIAPFLQQTNYDVRDFSPVTMINRSPQVLVVTPTLAAKSVNELIALAKASPGKLNYASGSTGAKSHLAMELLKSVAGINIVRISYKGAGQALSGVVGAESQTTFATGVTSHLSAGRLRALGISGAEPSPQYPGIPVLADSGFPAFKLAGEFDALFVPAGTPAPVIRRLHVEIARLLAQPDLRQKFLATGVEATSSSSPADLAATIKAETQLWGKLIKDIGLRAE